VSHYSDINAFRNGFFFFVILSYLRLAKVIRIKRCQRRPLVMLQIFLNPTFSNIEYDTSSKRSLEQLILPNDSEEYPRNEK